MNTTAYPTHAAPTATGADKGHPVVTALGKLFGALGQRVSAWASHNRPSHPSSPMAEANAATRPRHATQARALADRWARTDHRMAADLYCAADRDELSER